MSDVMFGERFQTYEKQDKVLVALSGGVDSSVCVKILQDQGFDVTALVIKFSPAHDGAVLAAKKAAESLGVPLHIADATQIFESRIIEPFCQSYCNGVTPSPCVMCNPLVKFATLATTANSLDIHFIASGHYARVEEENGIYHVAKAQSDERDQSYMLYRLPQEILSRLLLPVGEFEKPDIRQIAKDLNLPSADLPDSQEICFIPSGDYATYITDKGLTAKQGRFIGPNDEDLGAHNGVLHYTIGQRKGLGIAFGTPIFVKEILPNGDIKLANAGDEFYTKLVLNNIVLTRPLAKNDEITVKIRSRAQCVKCNCLQKNDELIITFDEPVRAPAPGQSAVLYCQGLVVGGGIITSIE